MLAALSQPLSPFLHPSLVCRHIIMKRAIHFLGLFYLVLSHTQVREYGGGRVSWGELHLPTTNCRPLPVLSLQMVVRAQNAAVGATSGGSDGGADTGVSSVSAEIGKQATNDIAGAIASALTNAFTAEANLCA